MSAVRKSDHAVFIWASLAVMFFLGMGAIVLFHQEMEKVDGELRSRVTRIPVGAGRQQIVEELGPPALVEENPEHLTNYLHLCCKLQEGVRFRIGGTTLVYTGVDGDRAYALFLDRSERFRGAVLFASGRRQGHFTVLVGQVSDLLEFPDTVRPGASL